MQTVDEIAARLKDFEQKRELLAQCFRQTDSTGITHFRLPISPIQLSEIKICGVDGGFLKKEYHGAGLILRRAVAVCFEYTEGRLSDVKYHPGKKPFPEPIAIGPEFSNVDFNQLANLLREEVELKTCIEAVAQFKPNVLIRDGSIVLHPSSMPEKNSAAHETYRRVIELAKELYRTCEENNILLVGAVEDSKGKRYCNIITQEAVPALLKANITVDILKKITDCKDVLENTTDTLFLYNLLNVGERTAVSD